MKLKKFNSSGFLFSKTSLIAQKNIFFFKLKAILSSFMMSDLLVLLFLKVNTFKNYSIFSCINNLNYFRKLMLLSNTLLVKKFKPVVKNKKKVFFYSKIKNKIFYKKLNLNFVLKNWYISKFFYFIIKYTLLFFFDRLFFRLQPFQFFLSIKNIKYFFSTNIKLKKKLFYLNKQVLPLFFYKKNFFFFSVILTYSLLNHSLTLILESLEKFLRRILGKRHFISHFLNTLRFFKKISYLLAYCFLLRGTIEKHGRTLTFFLIRGKLSLQTFKNIIYYDYIQCYQKYGVFGLHLWIRYQTNTQRLNI